MSETDLGASMEALLMELVRCPTENRPPDGFEAAGQAVLEAAYRRENLEITRLCPASLPDYPRNPLFLPRNFSGREDLLGRWRGTGGGRSLLLTGHMDVAPKEPMPWTVTQPYEPIVKDGRMYGRGTADMKAGLVCALEAVRRLKKEGFAPRGDVFLESVVDEEYAGANGTLAARMTGFNADFGIILEPSGLNICPACVGGLVYNLRVKGQAGMPYTGEEIANPALDIARLIGIVEQFSKKRMAETQAPALWKGTVQGAQIVVLKVKAGECCVHDGQLSAPLDAWMEICLQTYPGEEEETVLSALKAYIRERYPEPEKVMIRREYRYCRPAATDPDHPAVRLLEACAAPYTDRARVCGAMFSCDMFALTEVGRMPATLFGPVGERLHAPDEWVDLESMEICVKTLMDFIRRWCG